MTVANRKPLFVGQPKTTQTAMPATANANRDGTGTITTIFAANTPTSANGYLVEVIHFIAVAASAVSTINLFRSIDAGATWKFIGQTPLRTVITPSATVIADEVFYAGVDMPIRLNSGDLLGAAPTTANAYNAIVQGGALDNLDTAPVTQ